jgi:small-conductance mechanosensitive channel
MDLSLFQKIWNLELYKSGENIIRLNQILIAFLVIFIGISVSRKITNQLLKRISLLNNINMRTGYLLKKIIFNLMTVIVVLIALPIAGIPITIFTVIGGAFAIGIGFGAQNLFNNLISGFIIIMERPIRIGDIVEMAGEQGKIEDIGNRCVRIKRIDGVDLIVPNSFFLEQTVVNWTLSDYNVRGSVKVGVAYGSDTKKVESLILKVAHENNKVNKTPKPTVLFEDFGDNSLVFNLLFWTRVLSPMELMEIESQIRYGVDSEFRKAGIVIAFPQRDIHIESLNPIEVKISKE